MDPNKIAKGSEHSHQAALFCQLANHIHIWPELAWVFAIPNGGMRSKTEAVRLKAEGVKSGVSDIFGPIPRAGYHGFFVEMKKPGMLKNESDNQKAFGAYATSAGYIYKVFDHWLDAWEFIVEYLEQ